MQKKVLVQRIKDKAGMAFGDRTVAVELSHVFNSVIGQLFATNPNQYEYFSKEVVLPVVNRVATLNMALVQNKWNGSGVPRCQPTGVSCTCLPDNTVMYPAPAYALSTSVDAASVPGMYFYKVTSNQVKFGQMLPMAVTEVLATVVPDITEYDDDEYINLPAGAAEQIIDLTVAALSGQGVPTNIYKKQ